MFKLIRQVTTNSQKCGLFTSLTRYSSFSSSTSAELKNILPSQNDIAESDGASESKVQKTKVVFNPKSQNSMVAAAFASLQENRNSDIKTPFTDKKLDSAKTIEELLSVSEGSGVSRRHALKVVSILADWSMSGKVSLSDFETDPRFIRLCRVLTKGTSSNQKSLKQPVSVQSEDLSTILGVTADDEAAKLVESITLPQMVKVMSTLAMKKRRSTLLLRSLAYNISANPAQLDLKQCGDLLYSMSSLNFIDENLLAKVANDICLQISKPIKKSSVIGSILTSVGLLKYKDPTLLDALSEWIADNHVICRSQDIFSLLMTLAILRYTPQNAEKLYEVIMPLLTPSEAGKALEWLEVVWSLVLLDRATEEHVSSVLNNTFIEKLMIKGPESLPISAKLKLLNIDGAAEYMLKGYSGPRIATDSHIKRTAVLQTKDKREMVDSVVDALRHLIQSELLLRTRINTGYGFYIDAECLLDKKCTPLPIKDTNSHKDAVKVAVVVYDYHDMTCGRVEPTGINAFASEILKTQGYRILAVPYTEFKPRDKLIYRVKYLETRLKELTKS